MYDQMYAYFDPVTSVSKCRFPKGWSRQNCLLAAIEERRKSIDNSRVRVAVKADLSKSVDCINHNFLITKFALLGCDYDSEGFVHNYLTYRKKELNSTMFTVLTLI